jgi:hypothetical protein
MPARPSLITTAVLIGPSCSNGQSNLVAQFATPVGNGKPEPCGRAGGSATVTWLEKVDEDLLPSASSGNGR